MKHKTLQRLFATYVIPTIFAMFISGVYQIIDGIFIGNYVGADGLAGINMGWSFGAVFLGYGLAVGIGVGSLFSIARSAEEVSKAANILGQTVVLLIVPGVVSGAALYYFAPTLVGLLGSNAASQRMAIDFLQVFSLGAPVVIGSVALPFIVRNLDSPNRATIFMAIGALINIGFSYLFVVILQFEVKGAAIANLIGEGIAMTLGLHFLIRGNSDISLKLKDFLPSIGLIKPILVNGSSGFFMYLYVGFIMLVHQKVLMNYGDTSALAIYTVLGYLLTLYYLTVEGIANGVQPIISDLYGLNNVRSLRAIVRMTLVVGLGLGLFLTALLQIFPMYFGHFFMNKAEAELLMPITVRAIRLNLFVLFLEGFFVIATVFFEALGEGQKALWITIANMFIQVPFLLVLPRYFGLDGVWLTMPLTSIILCIPIGIMMYLRYQKI